MIDQQHIPHRVGATLLVALCAVMLAPGVRIASALAPASVVSVRTYGAIGDGAANDTAAIQAAINAAGRGATIHFPAGVYMVDNFKVENRSGLRFDGDGASSVIKRLPLPGNTRHATFVGSTDIVITNLAFDANGIERFGGVNLYAMKRVRIENTHFFDSNPRPLEKADHYSYVFGIGNVPSEDIVIANNRIEDLQLEVDHARRVQIIGNTVTRAVRTAGIGIFTVNDGVIAEDYVIARNTVIDPMGAAFSVQIDPPTSSDNVFRRIRVLENTVIRRASAGPALRVGTGDNSQASRGNIFEDIVFERNTVEFARGTPDAARQAEIIFFNTSGRAAITFHRVIIRDNKINGTGSGSEWSVKLRAFYNSFVERNTVEGVKFGIAVVDSQNTAVRENSVQASDIAYHFSESRGGNTVQQNRIVGSPLRGWELVQVHPSDRIQPR